MNQLFILGPCALESSSMYFRLGDRLNRLLVGRDWYYKASFDKANRSSIEGQRGIGLEEGIKIFRNFKADNPHIRLTTDVHECYQVEKLVGIIDCIQIPAFLCRQTDLIVESARHFDKINIKKGQWMSPENMAKVVDKVRKVNPSAEIWLTERGSQFGYDKLMVDFGAVEYYSRHFDKVLLDCTHSTQFKNSQGYTSGDRKLAEKYFLSASLFGYNGVFAEVHDDPKNAISDQDCQLDINNLSNFISVSDKINSISSPILLHNKI